MKILCVEDGSVDIDALENGELQDGKILVYRQGSKPPFVLDIPNKNTPRLLKELNEIRAKITSEQSRFKYGSARYEVLDDILCYVLRRIDTIYKELQAVDKEEN